MASQPRIIITGSRGIPARYGGFETFAEEISALLVKRGFEVFVQCDPSEKKLSELNGAKLFYATISKSSNPLIYHLQGLRWGLKNCDIVLVAGVGGAIFYFLKWFHKARLITNTDGIESVRSKWSLPYRLFLRLSEWLSVHMSDMVIADSKSISSYLVDSYNIDETKVETIEYGAHINPGGDSTVLDRYNLTKDSYYLCVCRLVPENNVQMIIEGYVESRSSRKMVIVGGLDGSSYSKSLLSRFTSDKIIFTNAIYEKAALNSLRFNCRAYLHGHTVGGTNPSLLEAMGSRNLAICHLNSFNMEVTGGSQLYFTDTISCSEAFREADRMEESEINKFRQKSVDRVISYYNWESMADKYAILINKLRDPR